MMRVRLTSGATSLNYSIVCVLRRLDWKQKQVRLNPHPPAIAMTLIIEFRFPPPPFVLLRLLYIILSQHRNDENLFMQKILRIGLQKPVSGI